MDYSKIQPGDIVGIGIHTLNALRGYEVGRKARERGAYVVFGGSHVTLYPEEAFEHGGATAVVKGDGDNIWSQVLDDIDKGEPERIYDGGRIEGDSFLPARWDLMPSESYMIASVQTVRGFRNTAPFARYGAPTGKGRGSAPRTYVVQEVVELRRKGFRFILLADDNFYPVTQHDVELEERRNGARVEELKAIRAERFELLNRLAELPHDMVF